MIFTQPMIANQTVATPPAQIAAKSDQQRASGRAPYTFGQLAQATPGSSAGSASGTMGGGSSAPTQVGGGSNLPNYGAEPSPSSTGSSTTTPGDTSGAATNPANPPTALPPIDTSPNQTGTSGTGAGEGDKAVTPPSLPGGSEPNSGSQNQNSGGETR